MAYRDEDRLGPTLSEHRANATGNLLGGAACIVLGAFFAWFASSHSGPVTLKFVIGAVGFAFIARIFVLEGLRLRSLHLSLHERGLAYRAKDVAPIEMVWDELHRAHRAYALRRPGQLAEAARGVSRGVVFDRVAD